MPARTTSHPPRRLLTGLLALVGASLLSLALPTSAHANGVLLATATKPGSDGHPYHWAAPC